MSTPKWLSTLILAILFASFQTNAQNWEYVNYPTASYGNNLRAATVCQGTGEIFTLEDNGAGQLFVNEYRNGVHHNLTATLPPNINLTGEQNAITADASNIYIGASTWDESEGQIFLIPSTSTMLSAQPFTQITSSNGNGLSKIQISAIEEHNNFLYIVGKFEVIDRPGSIVTESLNFGGGLTSVHSISITGYPYTDYGFVAKLSLVSRQWDQVSIFMQSNNTFASARDLTVDNNDNVFISGIMYGSMNIVDFSNPSMPLNISSHNVTSPTGNDAFVLKIDPSGNVNTTWGVKQYPSDQSAGKQVIVDPIDDAIYTITASERITKLETFGSGNQVWQKIIPGGSIAQMEISNCGDVVFTGTRGGKYFSQSFDKTSTMDYWTSIETSSPQNSRGVCVVADLDDKINILGDYNDPSNSILMKIDGEPASSIYSGIFIGREQSRCCHPFPISLQNRTDCLGDPLSYLNIYSQLGGVPLSDLDIKWFFNGNQTSSTNPLNFLDGGFGSGVPTPGVYTVEVLFPNCTSPVRSSMTYTLNDCEEENFECEMEASFEAQEEECIYQFTGTSNIDPSVNIIGYLWDFGDGNTSIEEHPIHTYSTSGRMNVSLTIYGRDGNGNCCSSTFSHEVVVDDHCIPSDCKTYSIMNVDVAGNSVIFSSNSTALGKSKIIGYKWEIDQGVYTSTSKNFMIQMPAGTYEVCLTTYAVDDNGRCCEDQVCEMIDVFECQEVHEFGEGTEEWKNGNPEYSEERIILYPNPTSDVLNIEIATEGEEGELSSVIINNLNGQRIFETTDIATGTLSIDTSSWPSGMYICQILSNGKMISKEVVKY